MHAQAFTGRLGVTFESAASLYSERSAATGMETIVGTKERLTLCASLLDQIEQHRARTEDLGRGASIERRIIDRELRDLEEDILADPGALASQLVRVRPRRSTR